MANAKYLGLLVRDLKTNEERFQIVDTDLMPAFMSIDHKEFLKCIPTMIRKYVAIDRSLTNLEVYHFTNWSIQFPKLSKLKQDRSKLEVAIWALPDADAAHNLYAEYKAFKSNSNSKMLYEKV